MDHPQEYTAVEFCAGYAGLHLGLKRAIPNLRVVAFSEIEGFACANLVSKMEAGLLDPAPIWTDLKTFPGQAFRGKVGVLVAGYPCQPFSAAGKRGGTEDPRHLWPHVRRQIQLMQPDLCFFENVDGHISLGLREVLADLRHLGYRVEGAGGEPTWGVFSASEVGAPHQRKRVFILAVREDLAVGQADGDEQGPQGWLRRVVQECSGELPSGPSGSPVWPSRPGERQHCWEPPRTVSQTDLGSGGNGVAQGNAAGEGSQRSAGSSLQEREFGLADDDRGPEVHRAGEVESPLGRDAHGAADRVDAAQLHRSTDNRVDELRLLGNGVVPETAYKAFVTLLGRFLEHPAGA